MAFDPGLAQSGASASRQPYPDGNAGIRLSLEVMAQRIREGRLDPAVRGWAVGALKDAGIDGRSRTSARTQVGALLDALRAQTTYVGDPVAAEYVPSAAATLCLRPGLCLNGDDCDGLTVALASAVMSIGIPAVIVKQSFGRDAQEHVLVAAQDESGNWFYADPSTRLPVGSAAQASEEVWVDPLSPIGQLPEVQAELVSLGKPRQLRQLAGRWCEERHGHVWMHHENTWHDLGTAKPNGLGTLFGQHTAGELQVQLVNWKGFVDDVATSATKNYELWSRNDDAGYTKWALAWQAFLAVWMPAAETARQYVEAAKASWRGLNWTLAEDEYQALLHAIQNGNTPSPGGFDDLANQWDAAMAKYGGPATAYKVQLDPNAAPDTDVIVYKGADAAIKAAENAAKSLEDPTKLIVVSAILGAVVALGVVVVVKKAL